jgi:hypothetical protein
MALSPRKQALKSLTLWTGIVSLVAGAAIYLQVSGFVGAVGQLASAVAPGDPGVGVDGGGGDQAAQPPQANPQPGYGPPIAVTGGS